MTAFFVPGNYAFDTYDELVAALNDWLDRSDLDGVAQQMVALCEARLRRELQPFMLETSEDVEVTDGEGDLPSDYDITRLVTYDGGELQQVSPAYGRKFPDGEAPRGFSLEAGKIKVWPTGDYTVTVLYHPKLVSLSSDVQTNWLLDNHPDLYFFGSMLFAEGYLANDERAQTFKNLWDEAIAEVKRFLGRQRRVSIRLRSPVVV